MKQQIRGSLSPTQNDPHEGSARESGTGLHHWVKVLLWACALGAVLLIVAQSLGAAIAERI